MSESRVLWNGNVSGLGTVRIVGNITNMKNVDNPHMAIVERRGVEDALGNERWNVITKYTQDEVQQLLAKIFVSLE